VETDQPFAAIRGVSYDSIALGQGVTRMRAAVAQCSELIDTQATGSPRPRRNEVAVAVL